MSQKESQIMTTMTSLGLYQMRTKTNRSMTKNKMRTKMRERAKTMWEKEKTMRMIITICPEGRK